ncbi:hypothetical protein JR316_0000381 [Psilocybe cubensis]|uniref:Uncharacterized protein n=2 Tax=Psilocybe cubensis TaxID=181762 RepID=A0ACB8HF26_PSICU|nr:hypothetical protein JR316_0000381 [Psilocybe cubensis]KAH9486317.1 hypothetical protein JR316_0000381 [Psilocybe cubensis]
MTDSTTSHDQPAQDSKSSTTPPNSSTLPEVQGTPVVHKRAGMTPHAAEDAKRAQNFESFRRDISGKIIGPMPVKDFLKNFLPSDSNPVAVPDASHLDKVNKAKTESEMYNPFIDAFESYVTSGPRFVNSHKSTLASWDKSPISPDIILIDDSTDTTWIPDPKSPTKFSNPSIESIGIMLEFKTKGATTDPFTDDPQADSFEIGAKDGKSAKESSPRGQLLGQICSYATAHMANQFRTHVFSVLVFCDYARILYWDRAGVVVTEQISLNPSGAQPLAEFFARYARATPTERGVDPNVEPISGSLIDERVKARLVKNSQGPFYKIRMCATQSQSKSYIVAVPRFMGTASPTGRSTRTFKAYDMQTKTFVFMKDSWRVIGGSLKPEHERYSALLAAGVPHIPTVIDYHDIEDQQTRTSLQLHNTKRSGLPDKFRTFRHYRLVLKEFAKPIEDFKDVKELLVAFSDAIEAHSVAHDIAHILHRDISAGNIMIDQNGRGLLVDWDLSKSTIGPHPDDDAVQQPERTGTWQFISYRLGGKRNPGDPVPIHSKDDDLESFFYVLHWLALRYCEHTYHVEEVKTTLKTNYDAATTLPDKQVVPECRLGLLRDPYIIKSATFASPALVAFLTTLHKFVRLRYVLSEEHKNLLTSWRNAALEKHKGSLTETELTVEVTTQMIIHDIANPTSPVALAHTELSYFARSLEPNWASSIFAQLFGSDGEKCDWKTGSSRVFRGELSTSTRLSLNKRKSEISDYDDDEGKPVNKKVRKDGTLPSVHEEY